MGYQCEQCKSRKKVEKHHIVPLSMGGEDEPHNWQWLCRKCHVKAHSAGGHWREWGQKGGIITAHESAPLLFLFNLAQFRNNPAKRRAYVESKRPDLLSVYEQMEVYR